MTVLGLNFTQNGTKQTLLFTIHGKNDIRNHFMSLTSPERFFLVGLSQTLDGMTHHLFMDQIESLLSEQRQRSVALDKLRSDQKQLS